MTTMQRIARQHPTRLAEECAHPRFAHRLGHGESVVLTVDAGYE